MSELRKDIEVEDIIHVNKGVEQVIAKAADGTGGATTLKLWMATYYPTYRSEIREDYKNYNKLLAKLKKITGYERVGREYDNICIHCGDVRGSITIQERRGPLYTATVSIEEMCPLGGVNGSGLEQEDLVKLFISPKALAPWEHVIYEVGTTNRQTPKLSTLDAEGSRWLFYLAPAWYDYNAPNRGYPIIDFVPTQLSLSIPA